MTGVVRLTTMQEIRAQQLRIAATVEVAVAVFLLLQQQM
jgi:hypothetical protein